MINDHHQIGKLLTWDELEDVVIGLRMYLVDGDRFSQTGFGFYVEDFAPNITTRCMGYGSLGPEEYASDDEMDAELAAERRWCACYSRGPLAIPPSLGSGVELDEADDEIDVELAAETKRCACP